MDSIPAIVSMIIHSLHLNGHEEIAQVLGEADSFDLQYLYHDNWNGGIDYYVLAFYFDLDAYALLKDKKESYTHVAYKTLKEFYKDESTVIQEVVFEPRITLYLNWKNVACNITKEQIVLSLTDEMETLIAAGTGKISIKGSDANSKYQELYHQNSLLLKQLGLKRSNAFESLWDWYGYYSCTLSTYQDRRVYIHSVYDPLIKQIRESKDNREQNEEPNMIVQLQEAMPSVQTISQQAFEEFGRAIKAFKDANENRSDERARKDAVRSVASAMEAIIKTLGGTDDIKTSSRALRDADIWGPDEIVKEGDAIFNTLHRLYPDLRHGSRDTSVMSFEEAEYWVGKMANYISYMRKRKNGMEVLS